MPLPLLQNAQARGYAGRTRSGDYSIPLQGRHDVAVDRQTGGTFGLTTDWWQGHVEQQVDRISAGCRRCMACMNSGGRSLFSGGLPKLATCSPGVQRVIEDCEKNGWGWSLWAPGDWSDGFGTYGAQIKAHAIHPFITGKR